MRLAGERHTRQKVKQLASLNTECLVAGRIEKNGRGGKGLSLEETMYCSRASHLKDKKVQLLPFYS